MSGGSITAVQELPVTDEEQLLKTRRGDYQLPHLMRWRDREAQPRFPQVPLIGADTKIAAIGSCFAERVTEVLSARGMNTTFHPTGLQYNTFSILQEFRHLFTEPSPYSDDDITLAGEHGWEHPFRKSLRADSREQILAMQAEADAQALEAYSKADLVIITLGLTEIWQRTSDGLVAVELPPAPLHERGDFQFRSATTAENIANLHAIVDVLREHTSAEILVTVSPVPLHATFRDMDVVVANCESKTRLRAAVADFLEQRPDVHYFHSYELVAHWQGPESFFLEDGRHVSPEGVAFIMNEFLRMYGKDEVRPDFVPFGEVAMPDQTLKKRLLNLRAKARSKARQLKGMEG